VSFDDIDDLFGGGGKGPASITVKNINDVAGGIIFKMERLEERDDNGAVKLNERGKPKPLFVTWVITDLRDPMNPEDDGARRIWWKGNSLWELQNFLRENSLGAPKIGGYIAMKLIGTKPSGRPQPMKLHAATYRPHTNETEAQARQFAAKWERPAPQDDMFGPAPSVQPQSTGRPATTLDSMRSTFTDEPPF
jgi:hypothetical protein